LTEEVTDMPRKYTAEEREARARPGYHDPTVSPDIPPARSALTMRLVLASFGLVLCGLLSVAFVKAHQTVLAAIFAFFAAVALVDIIVVARRKLRGEPGLAASAGAVAAALAVRVSYSSRPGADQGWMFSRSSSRLG
jgi:hypothetical protein